MNDVLLNQFHYETTISAKISWDTTLKGLWGFADFNQHAKKVVSDSWGLVDFAIRLVNSVLNLHDREVKFLVGFKKKNCEINSAHQNVFGASWNDVWASKC